jgi:tetratricopeptide (TPR) repeat protein
MPLSICVGALAVAATVDCPLSHSASPGPEELLRFAHGLRRDGRLIEAAACYSRLTQVHPKAADGWFELGLAKQELASGDVGMLAVAAAAFVEGLRLQPAAAGRLREYAHILQTAGRMDEARVAYRRAIAQSPEDVDAHFNLGTVEESVGDLATSLRWYRAALALDPPDEARIHNNIGGVLQATGRLDAAHGAYSEALDADPTFSDAWYNLGNLLLARGRHAEAEAKLINALRSSPAHDKASQKLEQVRASALASVQQRHGLEQERQRRERAQQACSQSNIPCADEWVTASRAALEADGPMFV